MGPMTKCNLYPNLLQQAFIKTNKSLSIASNTVAKGTRKSALPKMATCGTCGACLQPDAVFHKHALQKHAVPEATLFLATNTSPYMHVEAFSEVLAPLTDLSKSRGARANP